MGSGGTRLACLSRRALSARYRPGEPVFLSNCIGGVHHNTFAFGKLMAARMAQGKRTVSDSEIIAVISDQDDPFVTAAEVAELFGMTRQWAHNRLQDLHDTGRINRKKSGPRNVIWWVPED